MANELANKPIRVQVIRKPVDPLVQMARDLDDQMVGRRVGDSHLIDTPTVINIGSSQTKVGKSARVDIWDELKFH